MAFFQSTKKYKPEKGPEYAELLGKVTRALSAYFGNTITNLPDKIEAYINDGYLLNADVYTIVSYMIRKISGVNWMVYEVKDTKALRKYKATKRPLTLKAELLKTKALEEATDSELFERLQYPNDGQAIDAFASESVGYLALTGNYYWANNGPDTGPNRGKVTQAMNLPAQITQIVTGSASDPIKAYKVLYNQTETFDAKTVYHCKLFNPAYSNDPYTHLYGLSPLKALSRIVYTSNESIEANAKLLKHLGAIGVLTPDSAYLGSFTTEQAQSLQKGIDQKYNNPSQYGRKMVSSIPMKWQDFGMSVEELAIIDLQKLTFTKLCNAYGLDPNLFGTDTMRDNNKQQAARDAWYNCLMFYLDKIKEGLNNTFAASWSKAEGKKYYIDYDLSDVEELQKDYELLTRQAMANHVISVNEKRRVTGYDDLPAGQGGENFLVPAGLMVKQSFQPESLDLEKFGEYGQRI